MVVRDISLSGCRGKSLAGRSADSEVSTTCFSAVISMICYGSAARAALNQRQTTETGDTNSGLGVRGSRSGTRDSGLGLGTVASGFSRKAGAGCQSARVPRCLRPKAAGIASEQRRSSPEPPVPNPESRSTHPGTPGTLALWHPLNVRLCGLRERRTLPLREHAGGAKAGGLEHGHASALCDVLRVDGCALYDAAEA